VGGAATDIQSASDVESESRNGEKEELPPLTQVQAPEGIVGRFRLKNPAALADDTLEAFAVPFDWRKRLADESDGEFFRVMDVEGSIEGALAMDPAFPSEPFRVVSWGVKGVEPVLALLDSERTPVNEVRGGKYRFALDGSPCVLGRALGASPARIVCSDEVKSLQALGDYALRGMALEKLSEAAVHMHADFRPVQERYGKELRRARLIASMFARTSHVGHPRYDRALTDAAIGMTDEAVALLDDLETVQAQLHLNKDGSFRAALRVGFETQVSTTAKSLVHLAERQSTAPEAFLSLPANVGTAGYSRELTEEMAAPWMSILVDLMAGWFESEGASLKFSRKVESLLRGLGPKGKESLSASGPLMKKKRGELEYLAPSYQAYGLVRPKAEVLKILSDLSFLTHSPDLKKVFPRLESMSFAPTLKKQWKKVPGFKKATVYEWDLGLNAQLEQMLFAEPTSSEMTPGLMDTVRRYLRGTLAVQELNGVTWITWSPEGSLAELGQNLRALSNKKGKKLKSSEVSEFLRKEKAVSGGLVTMDGFAHGLGDYLDPSISTRWPKLLSLSPHAGKVPMTYFVKVEPGSVVQASFEWNVPAGFTEDAASIASMLIAEFGMDAFSPEGPATK